MWLAHAVFWPTLAASHYAKRSTAGAVLVFVLMLTLAFTHEGALVLAFAIVATLALRGLHDAAFLRGTAILVAVLAMAAAMKLVFPPDEYYAGVFLRAALHFFDFTIFQVPIVMLLFAVAAGYGALLLALTRLVPGRAYLYAAVIVAIILAIYWLRFDDAIHASSRYYLRTVLVIVTPVFGGAGGAERHVGRRPARLRVADADRNRAAGAGSAAACGGFSCS